MKLTSLFYQRGNSDEGALGCLVIIGIIGWAIYTYQPITIFGGEREGSVKFDDCREVVYLNPDTIQKYYKTFTCSYRKTDKGVLLNSNCVHVDNDSTLFTSSHTCKTAYVYSFQLEKNHGGCSDLAYPYLGYDDKCYSEPQ